MLYNIEEYYQLSFSFLSYAIRGTQHRATLQWVAALDRMRGLGAELMVPAHTQPLEGEQQIRTVDILQLCHDFFMVSANHNHNVQ